MVSFSNLDIIILVTFFAIVLLIGFIPSLKKNNSAEGFLLSGRKVGLFLFVLTNVATWYGGILGVGEFTYKYGILSWFTQGLPYYLFALVFAFALAPKIREASLFTIPDKIEQAYGKHAGTLSAVLVFILVSPAPYLLMLAILISMVFELSMIVSILIGIVISSIYLFKGGYKSDVLTDAFEFFVMFIGFAILFFVSSTEYGGVEFLKNNLPESHLSVTGDASITFIIVWFLIALWTFTDPGFHQRCYAAKTPNVAKYGIIISIFFWALFDFLTTSTGLFSRAVSPDADKPLMAFPLLAENVLGSGLKGIFYAALFATILSTLNSFLFLSATTFGKDFLFKLKNKNSDASLIKYTRIGLFVTAIIAGLLAYYVDSVIELWYTIGSVCIPGIIFLVLGAYYKKFHVSKIVALTELIIGPSFSIIWLIVRSGIPGNSFFLEIEPMIVGLTASLLIHIFGISKKQLLSR